MTCERCRNPQPTSTSCSYFNTQLICLECVEKERKHPMFAAARAAEEAACRAGDFNFPGIGAPTDLF